MLIDKKIEFVKLPSFDGGKILVSGKVSKLDCLRTEATELEKVIKKELCDFIMNYDFFKKDLEIEDLTILIGE